MRAEVVLDSCELDLTMVGSKKNENLHINGKYPHDAVTRWLFSQLGLMHLVAPYFPDKIRTNFFVSPITEKLICAMYACEHYPAPKILSSRLMMLDFVPPRGTSARKALNSYSGGKDSMWNQNWMEKKYGADNVMTVHIAGLNKAVAAGERKTAEFQAERFGFHHFRIVELKKSSGEVGAKVLRSGKIFTSSLLIPIALEFGARYVVTEEPGGGSCFTGQHESMYLFNHAFLEGSGIPVRVIWRNRPRDGVVKDLILHRPDWLPHVHNCFSPLNYKVNIRKSWLKRTPTFPPFEAACGSCVKCRITRLGWLL
jgi:hypothetical protein